MLLVVGKVDNVPSKRTKDGCETDVRMRRKAQGVPALLTCKATNSKAGQVRQRKKQTKVLVYARFQKGAARTVQKRTAEGTKGQHGTLMESAEETACQSMTSELVRPYLQGVRVVGRSWSAAALL